MSRLFVTDNYLVSHGSAAVLDDLETVAGGFTWWAWVFPVTEANGYGKLVSKVLSNTQGWYVNIGHEGTPGQRRLAMYVGRGAGNTSTSRVVSSLIEYGRRWQFVAGWFNDATTPRIRLFYGDRYGVQEVVGTYVAGTGASPSPYAAGELSCGDMVAGGGGLPCGCRIQRAGIVKGRTLSREALAHIARQVRLKDTIVPGTVLAVEYEQNDLRDYSGQGNHGTLTGAPPRAPSPLWMRPERRWGLSPAPSVTREAALAGSVTGSITENDLVTGGETITLTLSGDTWIP